MNTAAGKKHCHVKFGEEIDTFYWVYFGNTSTRTNSINKSNPNKLKTKEKEKITNHSVTISDF